jgi:hypothetical protein
MPWDPIAKETCLERPQPEAKLAANPNASEVPWARSGGTAADDWGQEKRFRKRQSLPCCIASTIAR